MHILWTTSVVDFSMPCRDGIEASGEILVIGERTVRNHVSSILGKLHLANRTQAALYALREGLAELDLDQQAPGQLS